MSGERFGTTAVEIYSCYVVLDGESCLDGEGGRGGTELEDEVGFFDRVGPEDRDVGPDVIDDAGAFWER